MATEFFAIILVMSFIAMTFVVYPMLKSPPQRDKGYINLPVLFGIAAIVLAIAIYALIGRPNLTEPSKKQPNVVANVQLPQAKPDSKQDSVASLVGGLEERVLADPDNGKDWLLLAKSYAHLDRLSDARDAYERAVNLGIVDSNFESLLGAQTNTTIDGAAVSIQGRVSLSESAMQIVQPSDTVFVLAREAGGSPMPLAVVKKSAKDLPISFVLSDANSMVAGLGISSAEKVVVEAKISGSGDALTTKAGLVARTEAFAPADAPLLELVLSPTKPQNNNSE